MLKNAWDKAVSYVPDGIVNFFGGGRYIKYDGTPYDVKGPMSLAYRPETQAATATVLIMTGLHMMREGTFDITSAEILNTAFTQVVGGVLGVGMATSHHSFERLRLSKAEAPIDTEGRDLSRSQISLKDAAHLEAYKNFSRSILPLDASVFALGFMTNTSVATMGAALMAFSAGRFIRSSKLLSGDYCFCDQEPPKETERSASVQGALAEPGV